MTHSEHPSALNFSTRESLAGKAGSKACLLILDKRRVHHSQRVKAGLAERKDETKVFGLSSYGPELKSDDRLNADPKHGIGSKAPTQTNANLKAADTAHRPTTEQNLDRVRSYVRDPRMACAAQHLIVPNQ